MSTKSTSNTLIFLIIILGLVVCGLAVYTFKFYSELESAKNQLAVEKQILVNDLNEEIARYNKVIEEKTALQQELIAARTDLEQLQLKVTSQEATPSLVIEYQRALRALRKEREQLLTKNTSLTQENTRLVSEKVQTEKILAAQNRTKDSLLAINKNLETELQTANDRNKRITASNLTLHGVIQRNSGKLVYTERASRAEMLQICFTIDENLNAPQGDQMFYTQVLDAQGHVQGVPRSLTMTGGKKLAYSIRTRVPYSGKSYTACELVLPIQRFSSGEFTINLYHDLDLLTTQTITLK